MRPRLAVKLLAAFLLSACVSVAGLPWDVDVLLDAPAFVWAESTGTIRSLHYEGPSFGSKPKTRVFALYASPATLAGRDAGKHEFPGIVLVHGGGGRAYPEWVELWAKRGYAAIAMDLYGNGPDGKRLPDGGPGPGAGMLAPHDVTGMWPYHAVADVILAHSLLIGLPEVDPERTAMTGISWGGFMACVVAGLDQRFKAVVPVYGCGHILDSTALSGPLWRLAAEDREKWVELFDPSNYLGAAKMPMFFVTGAKDFAFSLGMLDKSVRLPSGPVSLRVGPGMQHGHGAGSKPSEIHSFIDAHINNGVPLPAIGEPVADGEKVRARVKTATGLVSGALHYTTDKTPNKERKWQQTAAQVVGDSVVADAPPAGTQIWYLSVRDEREAMVSSPIVFAPDFAEARQPVSTAPMKTDGPMKTALALDFDDLSTGAIDGRGEWKTLSGEARIVERPGGGRALLLPTRHVGVERPLDRVYTGRIDVSFRVKVERSGLNSFAFRMLDAAGRPATLFFEDGTSRWGVHTSTGTCWWFLPDKTEGGEWATLRVAADYSQRTVSMFVTQGEKETRLWQNIPFENVESDGLAKILFRRGEHGEAGEVWIDDVTLRVSEDFGEAASKAEAPERERAPLVLSGALTDKNRYGIFDNGESVEIELTVDGDRPESDHILWHVKDYLGNTIDSGICEVPQGTEAFRATVLPQTSEGGYYEFHARLERVNVTLPRRGTRPPGMLTYGVLPELSALELESPEHSRFGIQGTTFCQSGVHMSGDSYNPLYRCYGVKWRYISPRLQWLEPGPDKPYVPKLSAQELNSSGANHHEAENRLALIWDIHSVPAWLMDAPYPYADPAKANPTSECQKFRPRDYGKYGELVRRVAQEMNARRQHRLSYMKRNYYQIHWEPDWHWLGSDEDFIKMYETAHTAIHAADPHAVLTGPNYGVISKGNELLRRLFTKGLGKHLDGITTHAYSTRPVSPEAAGLVEEMEDLVKMTRQYLPSGAPIYQTEWGLNWGSDFTRTAVPRQALIREMAWTLRAHTIILGEGATSTWFFYASDHSKKGAGLAFNLDYPSLVHGPVNISPKPVAMATAHLTRLLEGTTNLGRMDYLGDYVLGYAFLRNDETVAAIWSKDETDHAVVLHTSAPRVNVIDCMGTVTVRDTNAGVIELTAGAIPQYVVGMSRTVLPDPTHAVSALPGETIVWEGFTAGMTESSVVHLRRGLSDVVLEREHAVVPMKAPSGAYRLDIADDRSGQVSKSVAIRVLPRFGIESFSRAPGVGDGCVVAVANHTTKTIPGSLRLTRGDTLVAENKTTLPAGRTEKIPLRFSGEGGQVDDSKLIVVFKDEFGNKDTAQLDLSFALQAANRTSNRPTIDGMLEDWQLEEFTQVADEADLAYRKAPWQGPADLSFLYSLAYDDDHFFVALKVRDQVHVSPVKAKEPWRGDSVQLAFGVASGDDGKFQSLRAFSFELDRANTGIAKDLNPAKIPPFVKRTLKGEELTFRISRDDDTGTTVYEIALPWTLACDRSFPENDVIGFGALVNDADTEKQVTGDGRKTMRIAEGAGLYNPSVKLGTIRLHR